MSKLNINIENHDQHYTVSEMRRRLAQVLSKLNGDQEVSFTFAATLPNYQPAGGYTFNVTTHKPTMALSTPGHIAFGELARPEND